MTIPPNKKNLVVPLIVALSVIILIFLLTNTNLLTRRTTGSFEYIRKGAALMDKGKHLDAIKYFEKGLESSPENDTIKNNLVYVYSKYADKLTEEEKYDAAIEYLTKAYETIQNPYTMQNLAITYSKRALKHSKAGDWKKAEDDLGKAGEAADDSENAKRNLGISLFNDAVGEFKAGREDSAILLLKAAILAYPDSRIYEFLGDVYYKKNDLESARINFAKTIKIDPENNTAAEKLEKVLASEKLAKGEETINLPNFDIKYPQGLSEDAASRAAKILESAYRNVGKDLAYLPKDKTTVFFYSEKDFREIFKMPNMIRAFYDGNIRIPFPENSADVNEFSSYLYHEYTHAILSAKTNNNCPDWLNEGIAVYEELKWTRPGAGIGLAGRLKDISEISIGSLETTLRSGDHNAPNLALTYLLAYTAVEYIVDNWGMKGLDGMLKRIADGQHAVNAIDDEFLLSEKDFQSRWRSFVEKKYLKK